MTTPKRLLIIGSIASVAVVLYLWGHSDGREGRGFGPVGESFAADSPSGCRP